ncbi:DUF397 domain-containing protein [Sphaerisporangium fuscum]|uniref:DUF397 domain-containing protein n=1 Tax=Sphaerisporangium fuscum TaxID=2835868 RepID=UPI001BDDC7C8|nr:DUF397 domain-containing protein [Sphaerisporangium fuscum]
MDLNNAQWRKSSFSGDTGGHCVEVASNLPGLIALRDSKKPHTRPLLLLPDEWVIFLKSLKQGRSHSSRFA